MNEILQGMNLNNFSVKNLWFLVFGMNCLLFRKFFLLINVRHLSNFRKKFNEICHIKEQHQKEFVCTSLHSTADLYTDCVSQCNYSSSV